MPDQPIVMAAPWPVALLVCKDCGKRSSGPARLKPKKVAAELKGLTQHLKPRPRVMLTSCLGPCPKRAMTIGSAGEGNALVALVSSMTEIERATSHLLSSSTKA